jgi:hypothetical protein
MLRASRCLQGLWHFVVSQATMQQLFHGLSVRSDSSQRRAPLQQTPSLSKACCCLSTAADVE